MNKLVDQMIISGVLKTNRLIEAFNATDRKFFVPDSLHEYCYIDRPLSIGNDQTISQPSTVAFMLEHLDVKRGNKVLDIGSGSGWTTALLCHMAGDEGSVLGLERIVELVKQGKTNIAKLHVSSHCTIEHAGKNLGVKGEKFDRILVSAASNEIPEELFEQLDIGGVLVIPIQESIYKFTKVSESQIKEEAYYGFRFVPLIYES